ncbi:hypothetical protein SLA2020_242750 [Shorea laevis]
MLVELPAFQQSKSSSRGTRLLHSPADTSPFIGPRKLVPGFEVQPLATRITWPNKSESVGRRVQEASAPRTPRKAKQGTTLCKMLEKQFRKSNYWPIEDRKCQYVTVWMGNL